MFSSYFATAWSVMLLVMIVIIIMTIIMIFIVITKIRVLIVITTIRVRGFTAWARESRLPTSSLLEPDGTLVVR